MKTLPTNFYTMPHFANMTMESSDLKELLLETSGWITAIGCIWDIKSDHLGAGVYKVYLKEKQYG